MDNTELLVNIYVELMFFRSLFFYFLCGLVVYLILKLINYFLG